MWQELTELLLGLAGAGVVLTVIYAFIANAQRDHDPEQVAAGTDEPQSPSHEALRLDDEAPLSAPPLSAAQGDRPRVTSLYICAEAGAAMQRVERVEAVAGRGLEGDRYFHNKGHWSEIDDCEVTLIAQEDLDQITREAGIRFQDGRHRRNIVTCELDLAGLIGRRFRIGEAYFGGARPRPPCLYLQKLTQPGMARALVGRGGIGAHCFKSGPIRTGDPVMILDFSLRALLRRRWHFWRTNSEPTNQRD